MLVSVLKLEAEDVMQVNSNFINCSETANVELKSMLLSPEQKLNTATKRHSLKLTVLLVKAGDTIKNGDYCQISFTVFLYIISVHSCLHYTSQWHGNPIASVYS